MERYDEAIRSGDSVGADRAKMSMDLSERTEPGWAARGAKARLNCFLNGDEYWERDTTTFEAMPPSWRKFEESYLRYHAP